MNPRFVVSSLKVLCGIFYDVMFCDIIVFGYHELYYLVIFMMSCLMMSAIVMSYCVIV